MSRDKTDRQAGIVSQPVEIMNQLASFLWIYTKKCKLMKGPTKQSAASLQSFQLQFEVIVLFGHIHDHYLNMLVTCCIKVILPSKLVFGGYIGSLPPLDFVSGLTPVPIHPPNTGVEGIIT